MDEDSMQIITQADEAVIKCVLKSALGGAVIGGVAGSVVPAIGSGIGAVAGAMGAAIMAEPACRAAAQRTIQQTSYVVPKAPIESFKSEMMSSYGVDESGAHYLAQVGFVYDKHFSNLNIPKASEPQVRNAVDYLLKQKA